MLNDLETATLAYGQRKPKTPNKNTGVPNTAHAARADEETMISKRSATWDSHNGHPISGSHRLKMMRVRDVSRSTAPVRSPYGDGGGGGDGGGDGGASRKFGRKTDPDSSKMTNGFAAIKHPNTGASLTPQAFPTTTAAPANKNTKKANNGHNPVGTRESRDGRGNATHLLVEHGATAIHTGVTEDGKRVQVSDMHPSIMGIWRPQIVPTSEADFEQRPEVRAQCSDSCNAIQGQFRKQLEREHSIRHDAERLVRTQRRDAEEAALRSLPPEARALALATRGTASIQRTINMHSGMLRRAHSDIDEAANIVANIEAGSSGIRFRKNDMPQSSARKAIDVARHVDYLHNWAYVYDMARVAQDALDREQVYRLLLQRSNLPLPYPRPLIEDIASEPVLSLLDYTSNPKSRSAYRSLAHPTERLAHTTPLYRHGDRHRL